MAEPAAISCAICHTRRPRRYCPGVVGHICSICCGTERENTVNCPLDCEYLRQARQREPEHHIDAKDFPNRDIRIDEPFLRRNEPLLIVIGSAIAKVSLQERAIDLDVREALAAMAGTYRTLQSGLVYHQRPDNPIAGRIQYAVEDRVKGVEAMLQKHDAVLRDTDVLGILVFLQNTELQRNNGRAKSRAFIDFVVEMFPLEPPKPEGASGSSLIIP
jgi:hypothetical protein